MTARTAIPLTQGVINALTAFSPTTIDATNGMAVTNFGKTRHTPILVIANTALADKTVTFVAGGYPNDYDAPGGAAFTARAGDLTVTIPTGTTQIIVLDDSRFEQADATVSINFQSGFAGTIAAVVPPIGG